MGSASGDAQTRLSASIPPRATTASQNALPCSYWRSLRSIPISLLEQPQQAGALAAAPVERRAQARQVVEHVGADRVHHVLGVALEQRHERLHAVEQRRALLADHDRRERRPRGPGRRACASS